MTMTFHKEYPADQAAMQAMRAELRGLPTMEFGPEVRPIFDELMAKTPAANGVSYEAATIAEFLVGGAGPQMRSGVQRFCTCTAARTLLARPLPIGTSSGRSRPEPGRQCLLRITGLHLNIHFPAQ